MRNKYSLKKLFNTLLIITIISTNFVNSGCSRFKNKSDNKSSKFTKYNNISNNNSTIDTDIGSQLVSSAKSIEKSLAILAAAQEINNIPVLNTIPLITPEGGMGGTADIDWTGPLEPLLEKIASMTDYTLKVMGNAPSIPPIVSITQEKAIIADILKNACLQAGLRTNVVVFPASKIIELRYRLSPLGPTDSHNNSDNNNRSNNRDNSNKRNRPDNRDFSDNRDRSDNRGDNNG